MSGGLEKMKFKLAFLSGKFRRLNCGPKAGGDSPKLIARGRGGSPPKRVELEMRRIRNELNYK